MIDTNKSIKKTLKENNAECFEKYLMYSKSPLAKMILMATPEQILEGTKTWSKVGMTLGLELIIKAANSGKEFIYRLYSDSECKDDKQKKDVVLFNFPVDKKTPYIVVCAGGAYESVCSLAEAFPVAARLNELGYNVFVLNYRVGGTGVLPKPVDDLAKAVKFIEENAEKFNVEKGVYAVNGFSAGGNLTCLWGSDNYGYSKYGLPKPKALFPVYPVTSTNILHESEHSKFTTTMCGKNATREYIDSYDVVSHLDNYPPCYIVACKDDDTVPYTQSVLLSEKLSEKGIKNILELGEKGRHGFGEGTGTSVEGWHKRAIEFFESL